MAITTNEDNELLIRCINELFARTFIVREIPRDEKLYRFLSRHIEDARARLRPIGFDLMTVEESGVIMIQRDPAVSYPGMSKITRKQFSIDQSKVLLVLMGMYWGKNKTEAKAETTIARINDSINMHYPDVGAKQRKEALKEFKRYKLISYPTNEESNKDAVVSLHPSLAFCLSGEQLQELIDKLTRRLAGGAAKEEEPETDDFDEEDLDEEE